MSEATIFAIVMTSLVLLPLVPLVLWLHFVAAVVLGNAFVVWLLVLYLVFVWRWTRQVSFGINI